MSCSGSTCENKTVTGRSVTTDLGEGKVKVSCRTWEVTEMKVNARRPDF